MPRLRIGSYKHKPRQHTTPQHHSSRAAASHPTSTAAPKGSSYTSRFKRGAARIGGLLSAVLPTALMRSLPSLPSLGDLIPLTDVLGHPKLLLGVGLAVVLAYKALKF